MLSSINNEKKYKILLTTEKKGCKLTMFLILTKGKQMKDGVYFGLDEGIYHSLDRLSASGMKDILESPTKFWFNSVFNPLREEKKTDAMDAGTMFHAYVLEGEKAFNEKYVVMPTEIEMLNKNSSAFKLWKAGQTKKVVSWQKFFDMKKIIRYLEMDGQILSTPFLKGGWPEVSILWTDERGIARKARIDYLRECSFVDLKTFATDKIGEIESYIAKYFFTYKVYIQLVNYREALRAACNFKPEQIHGTKEQKAFFKKVQKNEDFLPFVLFINRNLPQARIKTFTKENCGDLWLLAENKIEKACDIFCQNLQKYGKNSAWMEEPDIDNLNFVDADFPQSFFEILNNRGSYE